MNTPYGPPQGWYPNQPSPPRSYAAPPPAATPRPRGLSSWVVALISGGAVFLIMAGVLVVLGANGEGAAQRQAVEACQQLSRNQLASPTDAQYSGTDYKVTHNYRDSNWEVVGSMIARDTGGATRPVSYACVGLYEAPGGNWYASSVANNASF